MKTALIAAIAENGIIGKGNEMPWHLPSDLKRFRQLTLNSSVIMGRKTFESIGKALDKRENFVITRNPEFTAAGVRTATSLWEALTMAPASETRFIIGGTEIYREAIQDEIVDILYLTRVHGKFDGDVYFPEYDNSKWMLVWHEFHPADEVNPHAFTYEIYIRKGDS